MARTSSILRIAVKASRTAKQVQFEPHITERLDAFIALHEKTHGAKPDFSDAINALLDVALSKQAGLAAFIAENRKKTKV
jgi:hypothetical protein